MVSKRDPKSEPKSQKWAPKALSKQGSKKHQKNMIFSTLECGSCIVNNSKIDEIHVWVLAPFASHFGGVLGAQMEAKAIKKPPQKNIKKMMPNMSPKWSQRGSQNGAKIVKNEVLEAPPGHFLASGTGPAVKNPPKYSPNSRSTAPGGR